MLGIKPGYIKRADLAWYSSHHHNAAGQNVPYRYSYLFVYPIDLPAGTKTIKLPDNNKVRILAISVADENPAVRPAQPLYDVLPAAPTGASDFVLSPATSSFSFTQGKSESINISVLPRSGFNEKVNLTTSGLPAGVTATFNPSSAGETSTMTLTASSSTKPSTSTVTITGVSGALSHTATISVTVRGMKTGSLPVDISSAFSLIGFHTDGSTFGSNDSLDGEGFALSGDLLGKTQTWDGDLFKLGPANAPNVATSQTIPLPAGKFASLDLLATGVEGSQDSQAFTVTYLDGTTSSFTQSLSDWYLPSGFSGESVAVTMPYRLIANGTKDGRPFHLYGYSFALNSSKVVKSVALPDNRFVVVFAMSLVPVSSAP
jgi:hypothetical protein